MGSDLYIVEVERLAPPTVVLSVRCIHPDVLGLLDDPGFALMLLHDEAPAGSPLDDEVAFDDLLSSPWMSAYARGFVASTLAEDLSGEVPRAAREDPDHPYWDDVEGWLRWRLVVTVTHDAWLEHLSVGMRWRSRAFSPAQSYQAHPPITPLPPVALDDAEGAFVWVPRTCYWRADEWWKLPPLIEAPAFPLSRYLPVDTLEADPVSLDARWVGRPVIVQTRYRGPLLATIARLPEATRPVIAQMGQSSYGCGQHELLSVSGVVPKATNRPGEVIDYGTVLGRAAVVVTRVERAGAVATFTLSVPPDGRALRICSETDALDVVLGSLWERFDQHLKPTDAPLREALAADGVEHGHETDRRLKELLPYVARNYIASFSLTAPPAAAVPLDGLSHQQVHEALSAPWPEAQLEVVARDPRWLQHLDDVVAPYVVRDRPLPGPRAPKPKATEPDEPDEPDERVVLWSDGRLPQTWMGERRGASLAMCWGRRDHQGRKEKTEDCSDPRAAAERLRALATERERKGWTRHGLEPEAVQRVQARIGATLVGTRPMVVKTAVDPARAADDNRRLRPGDVLQGVGVMGSRDFVYTSCLEELVAALEAERSSTYLWFRRPATGAGASISVPRAGHT